MKIGSLPAFLGMALVAVMTVYGIFYAVMAKEKFDKVKHQLPQTEQARLSGVDAAAEKNAFGKLDVGLGFFDEVVHEVFGWAGQALYDFSILMCQVGTAISYVSVIAESSERFFGVPSKRRFEVLLIIGIVLSLLSCVKTLRGIAVLSLCGLLTYLFVFAALIWESTEKVRDGTFASSAVMIQTSKPNYCMWFGIVAFAFGAFPIAITVYEDMQMPRHFFRVCSLSFGMCFVFYTSFAMLGYLCYGVDTEDIIYFNFNKGSFFYSGSLLSICTVLLFTYVLQMVPAWKFAQSCVGETVPYMLVRTVSVAVTVVVAYLVPSTAVLVEVTGSFAAAVASLSLPPLVYLNMEPRPAWSE
eukprot:CAMPEP_0115274908 /NCGR_PEP_ID=MMETSP0270-20121206/55919_1 /TAXON_ID=71861 /ORGANISM="Scrippsiella trochoidea, Strain CCMP3099" /LENGTH=355 /DNA_ID=CAMNT_0002691437 /DNA_START=140 /DNA_END=1204 /DNA_ORIENTATION=+